MSTPRLALCLSVAVSGCAAGEGALGREVVLENRDMVWSIALSPDGEHAAVVHLGARDFLLSCYALARPDAVLWQVPVNANEHDVEVVEFSPEGTRVATAGAEGTLRVFSSRDGRVLEQHPTGPATTLAWDESGTNIYFANGAADGAAGVGRVTLGIGELARLESSSATPRVPAEPYRALVFRRGRLYAGGWGKVIDIYQEGVNVQKIHVGWMINDLDLSADGKTLAAAFSRRPPARTPEVRERERRGELDPPREGDCAARIDVSRGRILSCAANHRGPVTTAALSPDGTRLASGGWDRDVHLEKGGATEIRKFGWAIRRVRFSPDGKLLAVAAWTPQNPVGDRRSAPSALVIQVP